MNKHRAYRAAILLIALPFAACAGPAAAPRHPGTAAQRPASTEIFVVRHAERMSSTDRDSPLSETGHARARALAAVLNDAGVDAVLTSQFVRTRDTAAPLVERHGLISGVERVEDAEASSIALARRVLSEHRGETVLVVGHSNTVHLIVKALGGADIDPLTDTDYDDIFLVVVRPDGDVGTVRSRYGAPD